MLFKYTTKLVRFYDGVDGLKTGFTEKAKYCLTATAHKNEMRLISVVMGVEAPDKRSSDTVKLLNYGFNGYKLNILLTKNKVLKEVKVIKGKQDKVKVVLIEDATDLLKVDETKKKYTYELNLESVKAPVKKGSKIGVVKIIDNEGTVVKEAPVTVIKSIDKANLWDYFKSNFKEFLIGKNI